MHADRRVGQIDELEQTRLAQLDEAADEFAELGARPRLALLTGEAERESVVALDEMLTQGPETAEFGGVGGALEALGNALPEELGLETTRKEREKEKSGQSAFFETHLIYERHSRLVLDHVEHHEELVDVLLGLVLVLESEQVSIELSSRAESRARVDHSPAARSPRATGSVRLKRTPPNSRIHLPSKSPFLSLSFFFASVVFSYAK